MTDPAAPTPPGSWRYRRRIIHCTLIYCAVVAPALAVWRPESAMVAQLAMALVALAGGTIGTYVFGAAWDDKNARSAPR